MADDARAATTPDDGTESDESWSTEALVHQRHGASTIDSMCEVSMHALDVFLEHAHPEIVALSGQLWAKMCEEYTTYDCRSDAGPGGATWGCPIQDGTEEANIPYRRDGLFCLQINENGRNVVHMKFARRVEFIMNGTKAAGMTSRTRRKILRMEIDERQSICSSDQWKASLRAFFVYFEPLVSYVPGSKRLAAT